MNATKPLEDAIFFAAASLADAAQRRQFLDQACAGNPGLRTAVEELLQAQDGAEQFFAQSRAAIQLPADEGPPLPAAPGPAGKKSDDEQIGTAIGPYKLLQRIGEGGCGVVYLAEQEKPLRRRVALKVIKLGMDTQSVIARFEAERQALALMDHPNIAQVLDAGTTAAGRPYFVMELVRGVKITEYCDQNRLDTRLRLELFIRVCRAMPSIILTTSDIVIASDDSTFFDPHVSIGVVSGREALRLARVLPLNITMRLALMGKHERMSAQRAYELGMISEVVPHDQLLTRARQEVVEPIRRTFINEPNWIPMAATRAHRS